MISVLKCSVGDFMWMDSKGKVNASV
jgi:hypothetical protein